MFRMDDELMCLVPQLGRLFLSLHVAVPCDQPGGLRPARLYTWWLTSTMVTGLLWFLETQLEATSVLRTQPRNSVAFPLRSIGYK